MANNNSGQPNFFMDQIDKNWFAIVIMFATFLIGYAVFKNDFKYLRTDVDDLKDGNVISQSSEESIRDRLTSIETEQKGFNNNQTEMVNALKDLTKEVNALKLALAKNGVISQAPISSTSSNKSVEKEKKEKKTPTTVAQNPSSKPVDNTPDQERPRNVILVLVNRVLNLISD